jgi:hypothetical protein
MSNSIIVYRNPIEQQMWEGLAGSDIMFIIFCSGIVAILTIVVLSKLDVMLFGRLPKWKWWREHRVNVILFLGFVAAVVTFNLM